MNSIVKRGLELAEALQAGNDAQRRAVLAKLHSGKPGVGVKTWRDFNHPNPRFIKTPRDLKASMFAQLTTMSKSQHQQIANGKLLDYGVSPEAAKDFIKRFHKQGKAVKLPYAATSMDYWKKII